MITSPLQGRVILLVISGGIAAYKSLDLIRRLREQGARVRCILTKGGAEFVTALSVAALSEEKVYTDLWSLTDEQEMGHIRLVRESDLIIVAPASANIIAKLAHGLADDLASTALLAANKPILLAPAMNHAMWDNPATQHNIAMLKQRGFHQAGPNEGAMACNETGMGRMADVPEIMAAITDILGKPGDLSGKHALVTSGPTYEPVDPVRFIGNRSSGKQGHAIAAALAARGASVTLVSGPVSEPDPKGVKIIHVETAEQMLGACLQALPADLFIACAAVADWRVADYSEQKIKKDGGVSTLALEPNPDILATIAAHHLRPKLVVGFAAETDNLMENAKKKLAQKGCDWLLANDVSNGAVFGADENSVWFMHRGAGDHAEYEHWPPQSKTALAQALAEKIAEYFKE
ncbi:MAG: bifunctional phosphopantothenoylcysteine decarboxylase/phosphopantothenate--cysteine ligase CoaBC [Alphaproteobacteria bacterium]